MTFQSGAPLPKFSELPNFGELTGCAWDVFGKGDNLGTVNLLTPGVVARAAQDCIKTGQSVCLSWAAQFPDIPLFGRPPVRASVTGTGLIDQPGNEHAPSSDDYLHLNTQSGSQWDGLRHVGCIHANVFYQNVPRSQIPFGPLPTPHPLHIDHSQLLLGIHHWAQHGITGRGVLLDLVAHNERIGKYVDPCTKWSITVQELEECAKAQGTTFRQGDILVLRVGFIKRYLGATQEEKVKWAGMKGKVEIAGVEQTEEMKAWLWDNHFAALVSDQPAFEMFPPTPKPGFKGAMLHETILGLWGCPIGEFFLLEELSEVAHKLNRFEFFFTSWPLNVLGGVGSTANAGAIF